MLKLLVASAAALALVTGAATAKELGGTGHHQTIFDGFQLPNPNWTWDTKEETTQYYGPVTYVGTPNNPNNNPHSNNPPNGGGINGFADLFETTTVMFVAINPGGNEVAPFGGVLSTSTELIDGHVHVCGPGNNLPQCPPQP